VLNTIVAESIDELCTMLEKELAKKGRARGRAAPRARPRDREVRRIIFNGDGYSEEWHEEAEKRGLLNLPHTLDALPRLTDEKNVKLFEKYGVLSRARAGVARRDLLRAVLQDRQHRGRDDRRDRTHHRPAGGRALPR
jgi:glutamine synthetase type III